MAQKQKIYIPNYISSVNYDPARVLPRLFFYNGTKPSETWYITNASNVAQPQNSFPYVDNYLGSTTTQDSLSLLFNNEVAPYGEIPSASLYTEYWENYVNLLYNPRTRVLNAKAIIPLAAYSDMNLNDTVQFRGNMYHLRAINDYSLTTGECNIQLLGPLENTIAPTTAAPVYSFCLGYDNTNCNVACSDYALCLTTTSTSTSTTSTTTVPTTSTSTSTTSTTTVPTTSTSTSTTSTTTVPTTSTSTSTSTTSTTSTSTSTTTTTTAAPAACYQGVTFELNSYPNNGAIIEYLPCGSSTYVQTGGIDGVASYYNNIPACVTEGSLRIASGSSGTIYNISYGTSCSSGSTTTTTTLAPCLYYDIYGTGSFTIKDCNNDTYSGGFGGSGVSICFLSGSATNVDYYVGPTPNDNCWSCKQITWTNTSTSSIGYYFYQTCGNVAGTGFLYPGQTWGPVCVNNAYPVRNESLDSFMSSSYGSVCN